MSDSAKSVPATGQTASAEAPAPEPSGPEREHSPHRSIWRRIHYEASSQPAEQAGPPDEQERSSAGY